MLTNNNNSNSSSFIFSSPSFSPTTTTKAISNSSSSIMATTTTTNANDDNNNVWWVVELCGMLAPIAAILVFMAPIPTIQKIKRDKSVGSFPLLPYTSMASSSFLWTTYGILKQESKLILSNAVGFVLAIYYVTNFIPYAPKMKISSPTLPGSVKQHLQGCGIVLLTTVSIAFMFSLEQAIRIIGILGVIFCLIMFASPLAALKTVMETQSAASIPLPFTVAATANCIFWTVWGLYKMDDFAIYFPNGLGLLFGLAQLALKFKYGSGSKSPSHQRDDKDTTDKLLPIF